MLAVTALGLPAAAAAAAPRPRVPDELIVKFKPGVDSARKASLVGGRKIGDFRFIGAEHWKIASGASVDASVKALSADPRVEYAEPNYLIFTLEAPDDPLFPDLWGLHNTGQIVGGVTGIPGADIDAVAAWGTFTGSGTAVVAIIDTGIEYTHPDLAANIWTNPGEIAGNSLDDDGNGYIDDIHGWDFANGDNDPRDDNSHGTHCAGTVGGLGNNGLGVVGVNWNVRLMALKFQNASGIGSTANAISCIEYATLMGVDVMSNSWGSAADSQGLEAAIAAAGAADIFFVAAAGNTGADNDVTPYYPSSHGAANIISVMATDNRDRRAVDADWASNYGASSVDIAAPGMRIWSTIRNSGYLYLSGTSMATPHVAGALAMLRGRFPDITVAEGRFLLLNVGNDPLPSLAGLCASGGRLNLQRLIADPDTTPPLAVTDLAVTSVASNWLELQWTAPSDDGAMAGYEVRRAPAPIISQADWEAAVPALGTPAPSAAGALETMRVEDLSTAATYWFCVRARDLYGNRGGLSNSPSGTTLAPPTITVAPSSLAVALDAGNSAVRKLVVTNAGSGVLDFVIPQFRRSGSGSTLLLPRRAAEPANRSGDPVPETDGSGGPDAYGYNWSDSDTPGGPSFNWIDISESGTAVSLTGDSNQGPFALGFTFPFYGHEFSSFYIGTHGCVSLSDGATPAVNVALPSASAPGNLLALLWDRMNPGAGLCRFRNDRVRLIVQYTNLDNTDAGGPYTMQMQLYPDGRIEYHYLTMPAPGSATATVGIQNGDGTAGLTLAFDTAYVRNQLAVRFEPPPLWLTTEPSEGSLAAGASRDVAVTFDGAILCGKLFEANLHVLSNDPLHPNVTVATRVDLTGIPDLAIEPNSLDFGPVRLTETATINLAVANHGCGDLTVQGLTFDTAGFSSPQAWPLVVAIGDTASVPVVFAPLTLDPVGGTLTLVSDDPDAPAVDIPLTGSGLPIPDIAVSPASLNESLPISGALNRLLTITNNGQSALSFTIPTAEFHYATKQEAASAPEPPVGDPGAIGTLRAGGPDTYGYRWVDSDDPRGPAYNWTEIIGSGTWIPFTSNSVSRGPYPIGFSFPFYGSTFTTFRVCSNGWLSFTATTVDATNRDLPSLSAPANLVAPYWDALDFQSAGNAYYRADGQRLIVEYKNVPRLYGGGFCSFQVQLFPSGRIEYHYQALPDGTGGATIGIQNATRDSGLAAVVNSVYGHANLAIRFEARPRWLATTPSGGDLAPGASALVQLSLDATGLCGDTYLADLHVLSNDPDTPDLVVPVALEVPSGPDARFSPASLDLGEVTLTESRSLAARLTNIGCAPLQITGLSIDNPLFTADVAAPFSLASGATRVINVAFTPAAAGRATGVLTLTMNDLRQGTLTVPLAGSALEPGRIVVAPASLEVTMQPGQQRAETVRIENNGAGPLTFSVPAPTLIDKGLPAPAANPAGSGGPDAWGYRWLDSDAVGGPEFSWIEIAGTGNLALANGTDVVTGPWQIGFPVNLYGFQSGSFYVGTDGYLTLAQASSSSGPNLNLPSLSAPGHLIAPFWDDIDLSVPGSGDVWYAPVAGKMVVQWDNVMRRSTQTPVTFEVIFEPSGVITFQYLSVSGALTTSATVGIQNGLRTIGLPVVYNAPYLRDNLAIRFWYPHWAIANPTYGVIPPGDHQDLTVTFNSTALPAGPHQGHVRILSDDPAMPELAVPLTLNVQNHVSAVEDRMPLAVALAQNAPNPFNPVTKIAFAVPVRGMVDLRVYDVRGARVRTLVTGELEAGYHEARWDGQSDGGLQVPSGTYFYRLRALGGVITRSMTLVK